MAKPHCFDQRPGGRTRLAGLCRALALAVCAATPLWCGCRAVDNAQVDVMERELRQQEKYIYELEDYLMEYSEKLRQCRSCQTPLVVETKSARVPLKEPQLADDAVAAPATRPARGSASPPPDSIETAPAEDLFDDAPTTPPVDAAPENAPEAAPDAAPLNPEDFEPPELEIEPMSDLKWNRTEPIATAPEGDQAPPFIPDPADYQADVAMEPSAAPEQFAAAESGAPVGSAEQSVVDADSLAAAEGTLEMAPPETIAAEPTLPPPADAERLTAERLQIRCVLSQPSEIVAGSLSSLLVVVEALNATNEPVDAIGSASLMIMAGETRETLQRVDRWDFTPDETQAAWQSSQLGDGLHLELPLGETGLPEGPLELWARLVTPDGRKMLAQVPFATAELATLDATLAALSGDAAAAVAGATPIEGDAGIPAAETEAAAAGTQWRASSQALAVPRAEGAASTAGGAGLSGWTRQPGGGRIPATESTPRVADATATPEWQQGTAEAPASESRGEWAPLR